MAVVCSRCIAQTRRKAANLPPGWLNFLVVLALFGVFAITIGFAQIIVLMSKTVHRSFSEHAADGLTRLDYAAASWGATIVDHSEPFHRKGRRWITSWGRVHPKANEMLSPSFGEPGRCFALKGSSGFVVVKLREPIVSDAITIEHVSGKIVDDAPKDCRVTAWMEQHGRYMNQFVLAEFSYDPRKRSARTFGVSKSVTEAGDEAVADMVKLEFGSNHGRLNSTCIYRLRVHGHRPSLYSPFVKEAYNTFGTQD